MFRRKAKGPPWTIERKCLGGHRQGEWGPPRRSLEEAQCSKQSKPSEWKVGRYAIDSVLPALWLVCSVGFVGLERSLKQEGETTKRWEQIMQGFAYYSKTRSLQGIMGNP